MCTVSVIAQDWSDRWRDRLPWTQFPPPFIPYQNPPPLWPFNQDVLNQLLQPKSPVSREEFEALKAELESLKALLVAAKKYDAETGQPDCEDASKTALFRQLAKLCGVDLAEVFPRVEG